jgi:DNA-binding NtrC family response regulator
VPHFLEKKSRAFNIAPPPLVASGAMERLVRHGWPGNVRELANIVERALIQHRQGPLHFDPIPETAFEPSPTLPLDGRQDDLALDKAMLRIHPNTLRKRMQKPGIA